MPESTATYPELFAEISRASAALVRDEAALIRAESRDAAKRLARHALLAAGFAGLLALSAFPLLTFAVLALASLVGGSYTLSALLVGLACAATGGPLSFLLYRKIRTEDFALPSTRRTLEKTADLLSEKLFTHNEPSRGDRRAGHYAPQKS